MKLYHFPSPNPQKVHVAILELGLECELVPIDLTKGEQRQPAFLALNPCGRVPVLTDGDVTVWDSHAILAYLGDKAGKLWPTSPAGRASALQWLFFLSGHVSPSVTDLAFNRIAAKLLGLTPDEDAIARGEKRSAHYRHPRRSSREKQVDARRRLLTGRLRVWSGAERARKGALHLRRLPPRPGLPRRFPRATVMAGDPRASRCSSLVPYFSPARRSGRVPGCFGVIRDSFCASAGDQHCRFGPHWPFLLIAAPNSVVLSGEFA